MMIEGEVHCHKPCAAARLSCTTIAFDPQGAPKAGRLCTTNARRSSEAAPLRWHGTCDWIRQQADDGLLPASLKRRAGKR
ncbi:hypothetical protein CupriaWKF_17595 [Cupriavidus sp. WKF15]|uniref:hypothetical protein n=1 Tax=Cupriavidus sp. WKF15 TaxID=3032282 RepID=UPI0023E2C639|nr:hypothetical protein [Cupriavidus sp. WKF15]WER48996.1 hypothetical protein CupriaWKF_17595 [Cupriavidus sp. WKF15]